MKAVYFTEHGDIDRLIYGELPDLVPGPEEVLVRVQACGINHVDRRVRQGLPMLRVRFPFTLDQDISGEVVAVGAGVKAVSTGTGWSRRLLNLRGESSRRRATV